MLRRVPAFLAPALAALAALWPCLGNGFVSWDDDRFILRNPHFQGWTMENLRWILTPSWPQGGHYDPLTWLSFSLDWSIWGLDPFGFHLTSLLIHAAGAAVFYAVARRLLAAAGASRAELSALFAAVFFAVHPLRVESVAWATERSDVLSGLFYLLTVLFYLDRKMRLSLACFAASLLSKSIGMTLPLVLVLLDLCPLGRLPASPARWLDKGYRAVWKEKLPFLLLALAAAGVAAYLQLGSGAMRGLDSLSLLERAGIAAYAMAFYVGKTVFPASLLPLYPMPPDLGVLSWRMVLSATTLALVTTLAVMRARSRPAFLAAWAFYIITVLPVSGLAHTGPQLAADRYTYLSCLGWALLGGWAVALLPGPKAWLAGSAWLLTLGSLAWSQCGVWKDTETLWRTTAEKDPGHFVARNFLANIRAGQGRDREALELYFQALSLHPGYGSAHNNLGNLLVRSGRPEDSLPHYEAALKASPGHRAVHYNWGLALMLLGRGSEAAGHFREELLLEPGHEPSKKALEAALRLKKRPEKKSPQEAKPPAGKNAQGGI
ncbi:MAG: tetratricopeptide repeat protein [Elusimicrobia bacterium]|nr:tetratricopeptide repeat protein [Elusimicrobiota bacterium]